MNKVQKISNMFYSDNNIHELNIKYNQKDYKFYVVSDDLKIDSGWEFPEDANLKPEDANLKPSTQSLLDEYNKASKDSIRNKLIDDNADKLNDLWDERNRLVDLSNKIRITNGKLSWLAKENSNEIDELFVNFQSDLSNSIKMRRIAGTVNATESGRVELRGGKTFENKERLKERGYKWTGDSWGKNTGSLPNSIQELRFIRDKF